MKPGNTILIENLKKKLRLPVAKFIEIYQGKDKRVHGASENLKWRNFTSSSKTLSIGDNISYSGGK